VLILELTLVLLAGKCGLHVAYCAFWEEVALASMTYRADGKSQAEESNRQIDGKQPRKSSSVKLQGVDIEVWC